MLFVSAFANDPPPAPAKVVRYARAVIQRYDANGDGILQKEEWEKMPGTPLVIDLDGDQQITLDELVWYFRRCALGRTIHSTVVIDISEPPRFDARNMQVFRPFWQPSAGATHAIQNISDDTLDALMRTHTQPIDGDVFQRLVNERLITANRPYNVLPEQLYGVPAWFVILDRDGDNQITLDEFAPSSSPARVELFKQFDKNGNGFIEPDEVRLDTSGVAPTESDAKPDEQSEE